MIINFYIPPKEKSLIEGIRKVSEQKRRSFSYIIREALEFYLYDSSPGGEKTSKRRVSSEPKTHE